MAKLLWSCLLLLLLLSAVPLSQTATTAGTTTSAGGASSQAGSQGHTAEEAAALAQSGGSGMTSESSTMNTEDGEVNEMSVTDNQCHFYISVASTNTSNSTVIDDNDDNTEVVLISSSPDVCFVRHVENATETCLQNLAGNTNMSENATETTDYVPGANLTMNELPPFLQRMCINRTITELVPADSSNSTEDEETTTALTTAASTGVRKKRFIFWPWRICRVVYRRRCYWRRHCWGWWWRQRCGHWVCSCYWTRFQYCYSYWGK